mmetsp:Transcript_40324/g.115293  ORF Transcript_40324/g.115293 Transcript_40324/m.115293 type:complete len:297 (-) Transcript_40324:11-901(-)
MRTSTAPTAPAAKRSAAHPKRAPRIATRPQRPATSNPRPRSTWPRTCPEPQMTPARKAAPAPPRVFSAKGASAAKWSGPDSVCKPPAAAPAAAATKVEGVAISKAAAPCAHTSKRSVTRRRIMVTAATPATASAAFLRRRLRGVAMAANVPSGTASVSERTDSVVEPSPAEKGSPTGKSFKSRSTYSQIHAESRKSGSGRVGSRTMSIPPIGVVWRAPPGEDPKPVRGDPVPDSRAAEKDLPNGTAQSTKPTDAAAKERARRGRLLPPLEGMQCCLMANIDMFHEVLAGVGIGRAS